MFTKGERPPRVVWNEGHPVRVLVQLLSRRLVDAEKLALRPSGVLNPDYFVGPLPTSMQSILRFLTGALDFDLLARWIPALSLLDWSRQPASDQHVVPSLTGETALYALFRPIFQPRLNSVLYWLPSETKVSGKPAVARRLTTLLQGGDLESAIAAATAFYRSMGRSVVEVTVPTSSDPDFCERLAATMLIPVGDSNIRDGVNRWLIPLKRTTT
jgi:CRISPR-associated protein Csx17